MATQDLPPKIYLERVFQLASRADIPVRGDIGGLFTGEAKHQRSLLESSSTLSAENGWGHEDAMLCEERRLIWEPRHSPNNLCRREES